MLKDLQKLMDVNPFKIVLHIPIIAVDHSCSIRLCMRRQILACRGGLIAPNTLEPLASGGDITKSVDVPILDNTKGDAFSLLLKSWDIDPSIVLK